MSVYLAEKSSRRLGLWPTRASAVSRWQPSYVGSGKRASAIVRHRRRAWGLGEGPRWYATALGLVAGGILVYGVGTNVGLDARAETREVWSGTITSPGDIDVEDDAFNAARQAIGFDDKYSMVGMLSPAEFTMQSNGYTVRRAFKDVAGFRIVIETPYPPTEQIERFEGYLEVNRKQFLFADAAVVGHGRWECRDDAAKECEHILYRWALTADEESSIQMAIDAGSVPLKIVLTSDSVDNGGGGENNGGGGGENNGGGGENNGGGGGENNGGGGGENNGGGGGGEDNGGGGGENNGGGGGENNGGGGGGEDNGGGGGGEDNGTPRDDNAEPADSKGADGDPANQAVLEWSVAPSSVAEALGEATVTVSASNGTFGNDRVVTLAFGGTASRGVDYVVGTARLVLRAGEPSVSTPVTAVPDESVEGAETIVITASASDGTAVGTAQTVTINDDDEAVLRLSAAPSSIPEASGEATVTVSVVGATLAMDRQFTLSFGGTASEGIDYGVGSTTLVLEAGVEFRVDAGDGGAG